MQFSSFSISRLPRISYGSGRLNEVPALAASYGRTALLVTGKQSFCTTPRWQSFIEALESKGINWLHFTVSGEPSPTLVDEAVSRFRKDNIDVVIAIGGGSVLDAAKAIAGLLPHGNSVMDHLEGVGNNVPYRGPSTPFIAVPTTAGTGSEATKNAVLSVQGPDGFKKSFRDECLIPEYAIIDPDLLATCPRELVAADGMDAFTQLLESYVSLKANPFIDALAWSGMTAVKEGFFAAWEGKEPEASHGRAAMAYAALLSGITLAQVGLGSVHGLASPLGAFFPIPHGVVCGTLVSVATEVNINAMQQREPQNPALAKYAQVGRLLMGRDELDDATARSSLIALLAEWSERLQLPRLNGYGISADDFQMIVANSRGSSMLTNPIVLTDQEIREILERRG
ncbi:iron-containing alcohol dehydrogenase [Candidatus Methylobacter oryzae]|uniref:Iron-containing alcohol dehydrogenase n=1 Tax=Candidatus Methylobacter oryzae TaxID=2497749 RepID=A0ABY3CAI0_9GAMM|nr:iron-containing alcohol dehydrogenase [Candidatus Methylobacter oryzae]TRW91485.1 iron-containing alcohol dehydrogenase [Candidatus Methylobacter oryzae]